MSQSNKISTYEFFCSTSDNPFHILLKVYHIRRYFRILIQFRWDIRENVFIPRFPLKWQPHEIFNPRFFSWINLSSFTDQWA
jgi:hypothetical protein